MGTDGRLSRLSRLCLSYGPDIVSGLSMNPLRGGRSNGWNRGIDDVSQDDS
ncbi:hypothetical protein SAMN05443247_08391 [Bradyrhizobium erythrophlei]|jgi:hypothetical protein|nr:hypothetical protein SAMN05443247_08391 [Bradyrhizobium erythrophlei]